MGKTKAGLLLATLVCASQVSAQTTQCMDMGGIIHCNTIGPSSSSSTDCMRMGGGMTTCNSIGGGQPNLPQHQTNQEGGAGIAAIIEAISERSFQKKINKLVSDGKCKEATQYAYEKGKYTTGNMIEGTCGVGQSTISAPLAPQPSKLTVNEKLRKIASDIPTPKQITTSSEITQVSISNNNILLKIDVNSQLALKSNDVIFVTDEIKIFENEYDKVGKKGVLISVSDEYKDAWSERMCESYIWSDLFRNGATYKESFYLSAESAPLTLYEEGKEPFEFGSLTITAEDCKKYTNYQHEQQTPSKLP